MSEHVLTDFFATPPLPTPPYVAPVMQAYKPRFNPYVIRRENRLLLCVPGSYQNPIETFELDAVELTRLLVGAHEALKGYTLQMQEGV
jgi:hypothetical protein